MGLGKLDSLMKEFVAKGGDPKLPAAIVDNGTRPNQRVVTGTVETIAGLAARAELQGPAIIILGTVVTLRDKLVSETAPGAAGSFANEAGLSSIQSPV
jgi:uroporphyrin-III C-methyltransferase/precorrin-2 dehydrogenase/sirohydrochlorin ferrochelatase